MPRRRSAPRLCALRCRRAALTPIVARLYLRCIELHPTHASVIVKYANLLKVQLCMRCCAPA